MHKLLFLIAFTFIGQQSFSQIYIATLLNPGQGWDSFGCNSSSEVALLGYGPSGDETVTCISRYVSSGGLAELTQALNSITSQGYKLIDTNYRNDGGAKIGE